MDDNTTAPELETQPNGTGQDPELRRKIRQVYVDHHAAPVPALVSFDAAEWVENAPPLEWLVEGLFPKRSKVLVAAGPKVGKSYFATALMKAITENGWFLGWRVPDVSPIWFFTEAGEEDLLADCRDLDYRIPYGTVEAFPIFHNLEVAGEMFVKSLRQAYAAAVENGTAPGLVIIDVMNKWFHTSDLNDYSTLEVALAPLDGFMVDLKANGGTLVVHHHARKGAKGDSIESALGSTKVNAFFDRTIILDKVNENLRKFWIEGRGDKGRFKGRWVPYVWDGKQIVETANDDESMEAVEEAVLAGMDTTTLIKQEVEATLDRTVDRRMVQRRIKELLEAGKIHNVGAANKPIYVHATRDNPI